MPSETARLAERLVAVAPSAESSAESAVERLASAVARTERTVAVAVPAVEPAAPAAFAAEVSAVPEGIVAFAALGRFIGHQAEPGRIIADAHALENVQNVFGKTLRKFHRAETVEQLNAPDVRGIHSGFSGDRSHDVPRGNVLEAPDAHIVAVKAFLDAVVGFLAFVARTFLAVVAGEAEILFGNQ